MPQTRKRTLSGQQRKQNHKKTQQHTDQLTISATKKATITGTGSPSQPEAASYLLPTGSAGLAVTLLVTLMTLSLRVLYVTQETSWWILHPDEIYQSLEVAHSEVYGYGFRTYEYLPPARGDNLSLYQQRELQLGMHALRSPLLPRFYVTVSRLADLMGVTAAPYLVWRIAHVTVSSLLPLAVHGLTSSLFRSRDGGTGPVPVVAALLTAVSVQLTVLGTHTLVQSLLAPVLFFSLSPIISLLLRAPVPPSPVGKDSGADTGLSKATAGLGKSTTELNESSTGPNKSATLVSSTYSSSQQSSSSSSSQSSSSLSSSSVLPSSLSSILQPASSSSSSASRSASSSSSSSESSPSSVCSSSPSHCFSCGSSYCSSSGSCPSGSSSASSTSFLLLSSSSSSSSSSSWHTSALVSIPSWSLALLYRCVQLLTTPSAKRLVWAPTVDENSNETNPAAHFTPRASCPCLNPETRDTPRRHSNNTAEERVEPQHHHTANMTRERVELNTREQETNRHWFKTSGRHGEVSMDSPEPLKLLACSFSLALCCYVRPDNALLVAAVVVPHLPSVISRIATTQQQNINYPLTVISFACLLVGATAGVCLGLAQDFDFYGSGVVSPLNWFNFNVVSNATSQLFGAQPATFYVREVLLHNIGMVLLGAMNVLGMVLSFWWRNNDYDGGNINDKDNGKDNGTDHDNDNDNDNDENKDNVVSRREIDRTTSNQQPIKHSRTEREVLVQKSKLLVSVVCLLGMYSWQRHKELRFFHDALVLYFVFSASNIISAATAVAEWFAHVLSVLASKTSGHISSGCTTGKSAHGSPRFTSNRSANISSDFTTDTFPRNSSRFTLYTRNLSGLSHHTFAHQNCSQLTTLLIVFLFAVTQYTYFPTPHDGGRSSLKSWVHEGKGEENYDVTKCLNFIASQDDVTGVFLDANVNLMGGFTLLRHNVPLLALTSSGYHEYDLTSRVTLDKKLAWPSRDPPSKNYLSETGHSKTGRYKSDHSKINHSRTFHSKTDNSKTDSSETDFSKTRNPKTDHSNTVSVVASSKVSNFFLPENTQFLLRHVLEHKEYNYLVLKARTEFLKVGYERVLSCGSMRVMKRLGTTEDEERLDEVVPLLKFNPDLNVLKREARHLFAFNLKDLIDVRQEEAMRRRQKVIFELGD